MESKFEKKLDILFWWLIWLLPLVGAVVSLMFGSDNTFADFSTFIEGFRFGYIKDLLVDFFDIFSLTFPGVLLDYASYLICAEFVHILVDVIIFIPRFVHSMVQPDFWRIDR